jgi:hypothetical protein
MKFIKVSRDGLACLSVLSLSLRLLKGSKLHLELEAFEHEKLSGNAISIRIFPV